MIHWGIIGCGNVTEVKSGPAFNKVNGSRLLAVMRRDAVKAKDYARRHGVPKWYSDAQQLIDDPEVTAIYIATPPLFHEPYALAAMQAGKPVYLEKPMSVNAVAAARICQASVKKESRLSVAHYRRQQPLFLHLKKMLDDGYIGKIQKVQMNYFQPHQSPLIAQTGHPWRLDPEISGGGLFHDLAPHQLDLMIYFFGHALRASGNSWNSAGLYKAPDSVEGEIVFENDISFQGSWCFTSEVQKDDCLITGEKGSIHFSVFLPQPIKAITGGQEKLFHFEPLPHVQQPMIQKVVEFFSGQGPNPCTPQDGLRVMELIDAFSKANNP